MTNEQDEIRSSGMDRRTFVKRAGVTGAMVWAAPAITTASRAFAQDAGSPDCGRVVQVFGGMTERSAPTSAKRGEITDPAKVFIWFEGFGNSGAGGLSLGNAAGVGGSAASIPPNTPFAVYMIHAQQPDCLLNGVTQQGGVRFSAQILGTASTDNALLATDRFSSIAYDQPGGDAAWFGRRFEDSGVNVDTATIVGDRVDVVTRQGTHPDQIRVFVACAPAATA